MTGTAYARKEKSRAPYGARGLKLYLGEYLDVELTEPSRPVWGAWIEIGVQPFCKLNKESRPVWGAWIEIGQ